MLVRFFIVVLFLAVVLLAGAVLLPANVHVERHIIIERPPAILHGVLNDLHHFQSWSPWSEKDPDARYSYSGAERGVGARMNWSGDPRQVGTGWQEITESQPYSLVRTRLDLGEQGKAQAYFEIRPSGRGSRVIWGFDTDVTEDRGFFGALMGKYMGLMLDHWIGNDYSEGLESLKQYAETLPNADYSRMEIEIVDVPAQSILYVSSSSGRSDAAVAAALGAAYGEISRFMAARGIDNAGQPMAISYNSNPNSYQFDAAIPIDIASVNTRGNIKVGQTPSGRAVRAVHKGPYNEMDASYEKIAAFIAVQRLEHDGVSWEHYISDPGSIPESQLITHVYFMLEE
ncbi:MAG TPA: GyrI-like domain-containing protein [Xanthomonadales bacterium]|nr:GyrI-like domain-containing protein [Xanthomonadales bacterium]